MDKRNLINFIAAICTIIMGSITLILPIFNITNIRIIFIILVTFYGIINIVQNIALLDMKEYSGFSTSISCVFILIILLFMDVNDKPLTKLKEADYYHDRKNKLWLLNIVSLILFILTGILTTLNLFYTGDIQILILGFFFLINGILDLMLPLVDHLIGKKIK